MTPKVSIIMAVLNGEKYIEEAIESILAQTYRNYELVIVDDGSTDSTFDKAKRYQEKLDLKYVRHPARRGVVCALNTGLRNARANLITFLDHDDAWLPEMLETQVRYLEQHPDVAMVHADFQMIDATGNIIVESGAKYDGSPRPSGYVFPALFSENFIIGTSVLIRKECFDRLGPFDESLRFADYHMWLRIARHYKVDYVPRVLTKYRQHPAQSTRDALGEREKESVAHLVLRKILELYPESWAELGQKTINKRFARLYFHMAYCWFSDGMFAQARPPLRKAIRLYPTKYKYYLFYLGSFLRPSQAQVLRNAVRNLRAFLPTRKSREERFHQVRNVVQR